MKFFIPGAKDKAQEQRIYASITRSASESMGADLDSRRVFKLHYTHDGHSYRAEVGKPDPLDGEKVIAILHEPGRRLYHVCTLNRGVTSGTPILVGEGDVISSEDFQTE